MPGLILGWLLDRQDRATLLRHFPPAYPRVVADHVTLQSGLPAGTPLPVETDGCVVGIADDGARVQALVVEIGGTTDRPDGSTYHITWSLAGRRKAVESNDVIRRHGWRPVARRPVRLEPGRIG
ncbi:hypothetical protein [Roseomonas marmotae]|uniref:Uncharacterized protein n=1 Tax=Roseomonas marmotae TaxID=2768161 RepID=A0ABS3KBA9_9PROT|nr:hypothetical protein [Roseomonas marmotae]MBO1074755.1 hypothetical protein [Roseomonas marmotae]QTI77785.1 hypothetical protein IAI58_08425 [Roseomonas marmotae]